MSYIVGEALQSISDCLMHSTRAKLSRTPRDQRNWYWFRVRSEWSNFWLTMGDIIIFHREQFRTLRRWWYIAESSCTQSSTYLSLQGIRIHEHESRIQCHWISGKLIYGWNNINYIQCFVQKLLLHKENIKPNNKKKKKQRSCVHRVSVSIVIQCIKYTTVKKLR